MQYKGKPYPPIYFLLTLGTICALHYLVPGARLLAPPFNLVGVVPLVAGLVMAAVAAGAFVRAGTPVVPFEKSTALVTTGLFRFTRNPMYLGMVFALTGAAAMFGSIAAFAPIPVFVAIIHFQFVRREEAFLLKLFGEQYAAYMHSVRRWL